MGACCSRDERFEGLMVEEGHMGKEKNLSRKEENENNTIGNADSNGTRVRFEGSSKFVSMFSQQGRKGINQDAMTVWEKFNGERGTYFCAVFDGHGPSGHRVAQKVRDLLPSKLSLNFKQSQINGSNAKNNDVDKEQLFSLCKANLIKSFEEVDEDLCLDGTFDTYCSGSTAVAVLKQGDHLLIANLGDSRAVLCTRDEKNQLVSVQLTVDLKPNLPHEAERIKNCEGRVFALEEEPEVFRIWMPEEHCPGLAMARAFGDFCLKDFGLISTPEVFYRKITYDDEFVVLATDGVWDVLSNNEVIKIVASAKRRSVAARLLVSHAVRAWRLKYPTSRVDDCAAICLFFKSRPLLTKSSSEATRSSTRRSEVNDNSKGLKTDDGLDTVVNWEVTARPRSKRLPRSASHGLSRRPAKGTK